MIKRIFNTARREDYAACRHIVHNFPTHFARQGDMRFHRPFAHRELRPQRPRGSRRRKVCTPTSTNAHRSHGDPSFVIRP